MARLGDESNECQYALLHGKEVETNDPRKSVHSPARGAKRIRRGTSRGV